MSTPSPRPVRKATRLAPGYKVRGRSGVIYGGSHVTHGQNLWSMMAEYWPWDKSIYLEFGILNSYEDFENGVLIGVEEAHLTSLSRGGLDDSAY